MKQITDFQKMDIRLNELKRQNQWDNSIEIFEEANSLPAHIRVRLGSTGRAYTMSVDCSDAATDEQILSFINFACSIFGQMIGGKVLNCIEIRRNFCLKPGGLIATSVCPMQ